MKNRIRNNLLSFFMICSVTAPAQTVLSLQKALQIAKSNNLYLQSQELTIAASQADVKTAKLYPNPVFSNQTIQMTRSSQYPPNTDWTDPVNRQSMWQLNQPIQLPTQRKWKIDVANKGAELAKSNFNEFERNLLRDVAQKWLDAWSASKQLNILEIAKSNVDTLVNVNKLRVKNQAITQTELVRAELLANQYAMQIKSARQDYNNKLAILQNQLAMADPVAIDSLDMSTTASDYNFDMLMQQAMNNRSDIQSLENNNAVATSNIKMQKSLAWPQPEIGVIWNPQNTVQYWGFFIGIELPIFSRNQGEIKKSTIIKQQAEQNLYATRLVAQTEITNAYNTLQTQKANLEHYSNILAQSEQILSSVKYAYLQGGTTIIDFLEAQRSWLDTRVQYYDILEQYRNSYIDVLYTSGLINQVAE